ncbi:MAG: hypothetical protein JNJ75_17395 [Cyclobacteriaceae bacterium]|nr:hypothetical protein [Cyclobacteriaceae bacterium]
MTSIKTDFYRDWIDMLSQVLSSQGYTLPSSTSDNDISNMYFNLHNRLIEPKPRVVLRSQEFQCPAGYENAINELITRIAVGEDLTPFLSKKLKDLSYNDDLINDWDIYHLHLGRVLEPAGEFIVRSGPVLKARFDDDHAYFINIYQHNNWTKQEMIQIINDNWPESIAAFKLSSDISLLHVPTDSDIKVARDGHVNTMIQLPTGEVYSPIGGGLTSSGIGFRVVRATQYHHKKILLMEENFSISFQAAYQVAPENVKAFFTQANDITFKLFVINGQFIAIEPISGFEVDLGPVRN